MVHVRISLSLLSFCLKTLGLQRCPYFKKEYGSWRSKKPTCSIIGVNQNQEFAYSCAREVFVLASGLIIHNIKVMNFLPGDDVA